MSSSSKRAQLRDTVRRICSAGIAEFDDLSDYIWKSVRLIEHETELELKKLAHYFGDDKRLKALRWAREGRKLRSTFPYFIATGNLLSACSLLELRLMVLAKALDPYAKVKLSDTKGFGFDRLVSFFDQWGAQHRNLHCWEQVSAAILIRNAVAHAGGSLTFFRHSDRLRQVVTGARWWSAELRAHNGPDVAKEHVDIVENQTIGERVWISNGYPHWVAFLFRQYISGLCREVVDAIPRRLIVRP